MDNSSVTSRTETDSGIESSSSSANNEHIVFIRVTIPALDLQKCLRFNVDDTVWTAKQQVLLSISKDLKDGLNYGLYCPPMDGKAGKFLDEERQLKDYPLAGPVGSLQFKYKQRIYRQQMNSRRLKQLHTKANFKQFIDAVRKNDVAKIEKLTAKGFDPNFIDSESGETPLTLAAGLSQCKSMMLVLIEAGSHLDLRNNEGRTAVHRAAQLGNQKALQTLLDLGSSPNYKDCNGLTPVYLCVSSETISQNSTQCLNMLLYDHATLGITDSSGWAELHQVCKVGRAQFLEQLMYYGADVNCQNYSGNTPLHVCAIYNQEDCVRMLLFRGADRTIINCSGQTPYELALATGNIHLADVIKDFSEHDIVLYRDLPQYNVRRRTPWTVERRDSILLRSQSNPSLSAGGRSHSCITGGSCWSDESSDQTLAGDERSQLHGNSENSGGMESPRSMSISNSTPSYHGSDSDSGSVTALRMLPTTSVIATHERRRMTLLSAAGSGFGFMLRKMTDTHCPSPHCVLWTEPGSAAERAGLQSGDFLVEVNYRNVVDLPYEEVAQLIRISGDVVELNVVCGGHIECSQSSSCQSSVTVHNPSPQATRTPTNQNGTWAPTNQNANAHTSMMQYAASAWSLNNCTPDQLDHSTGSSIYRPPSWTVHGSSNCHRMSYINDKVASIHSVHGKRLTTSIPIDQLFMSPDNSSTQCTATTTGSTQRTPCMATPTIKAQSAQCLAAEQSCQLSNKSHQTAYLPHRATAVRHTSRPMREPSEMLPDYDSDAQCSVEVDRVDVHQHLDGRNIKHNIQSGNINTSTHSYINNRNEFVNQWSTSSSDSTVIRLGVATESQLRTSAVIPSGKSNLPPPPANKPLLPAYIRNQLRDGSNAGGLENTVGIATESTTRHQSSAEQLETPAVTGRQAQSSSMFTQLAENVRMEVIRRRQTAPSDMSLCGNQLDEKFGHNVEACLPRDAVSNNIQTGREFNHTGSQMDFSLHAKNHQLQKNSVPGATRTANELADSRTRNSNSRTIDSRVIPNNVSQPSHSVTMVTDNTAAAAVLSTNLPRPTDQELFIPPPPEFVDCSIPTITSSNCCRIHLTERPIDSWSVCDVLDWLDMVGLADYRSRFESQRVNGPRLRTLGRNELIDLGMTVVGERMMFERALRKQLGSR